MPAVHQYIIFVFVFFISVFGLFGNVMVILAVRRHKDLKTKHGALLSFLCAYQSMVLIFELLADGRNIVKNVTSRSFCFYSLLPLTVTYNVQLILLLVISLDLIFLVLKPTKYNSIEVYPYAYVVQAPCFTFALVFTVISVLLMDRKHIIVCNIALSYPDELGSPWNICVIGVCIAIISVYAITTSIMWFRDWQNVRKSEGACVLDPSLRYQRKMMKTLSVLMSVFFCSGFASALITLSPNLISSLDDQAAAYAQSYASIPALISCAQNFYVYNAMSKDFHKAFKKNLIALRKWKNAKLSGTNSLFQVTMSAQRISAKTVTIDAKQ
ncbi:hypothetical protein ANCCEY_08252 [Ancylostoma ceylanicum]|uniref:G-protein coupled receptors family 1 profile domain-containing protein n=2 Tax=Ancylostoma ceylanicum TaxID=53326 RepID=A0A0D6LN73_9BILA|nr:hypothetical protein ANCCEY_08252 [Ancylostoma ceylanicum]EYB96752.1 hypothetical protein Y032_0147g2588 [Ancylostoma ceylanicum]